MRGDLVRQGEPIGSYRTLDHPGVDTETFAQQRTVLPALSWARRLAAVLRQRAAQHFAAQHGAIHFLRRKAVEKIRYFRFGDAQRLPDRLAGHHFGDGRARRNGASTTEGLKAGRGDDIGLRLDFQHQPKDVAA
jgi:hypothetical protein